MCVGEKNRQTYGQNDRHAGRQTDRMFCVRMVCVYDNISVCERWSIDNSVRVYLSVYA